MVGLTRAGATARDGERERDRDGALAAACLMVIAYSDIIPMRRRHLDTLRAIFATPTRRSLTWADVAACLRALGAEVDEGREGSRVRVRLAGRRLTLHRPHPQKELKAYAVEDVRAFLTEVGVTPATIRAQEEE